MVGGRPAGRERDHPRYGSRLDHVGSACHPSAGGDLVKQKRPLLSRKRRVAARQVASADPRLRMPPAAGEHGVPVLAIATLNDLLHYLAATSDVALAAYRAPVAAYRERYGVQQ